MFRVFTKKNSEYSKLERGFTSFFAFWVFGIVGAFVRLFSGPVVLNGESGVFFQFAPYVFGFGTTAAVLGYVFPRLLNILMCFIPVPGSSS